MVVIDLWESDHYNKMMKYCLFLDLLDRIR